MILVFSDIHLGRTEEKDQFFVDQIISCITSHRENLQEVIFLGDVFESFIEFPTRVDREVQVLHAVIMQCVQADITVSYFVGNHDPWHLTYFEREFGISPQQAPECRTIYGQNIYLSHGDEIAVKGLRARMARFFMRTPIYYSFYQLLPATYGQFLARWVSRRFAVSSADPNIVDRMAKAASIRLQSPDIDVVILGHSHQQDQFESSAGYYFNTGSWFVDLSYLEIWPNKIVLNKWQPGRDL